MEMDFNLSGTIDKEELRIEFAKLGLPQATVDVFVQHFESNDKQELEVEEFAKYAIVFCIPASAL